MSVPVLSLVRALLGAHVALTASEGSAAADAVKAQERTFDFPKDPHALIIGLHKTG